MESCNNCEHHECFDCPAAIVQEEETNYEWSGYLEDDLGL